MPPPSPTLNARLGPIVLDSEMIVLSRCVQSLDAIEKARAALTPDDFWQSNHVTIYRAVLAVDPTADPPPLSQVTDSLRQSGQLEEVGTHDWFNQAIDRAATDAVLPYHIRRMIAASRARQAMTAALQVYEAAATGGDWGAVVKQLQDLLAHIHTKTAKRRFLEGWL